MLLLVFSISPFVSVNIVPDHSISNVLGLILTFAVSADACGGSFLHVLAQFSLSSHFADLGLWNSERPGLRVNPRGRFVSIRSPWTAAVLETH